MTEVVFVADICNLLNELNISLQGFCTIAITVRHKMDAFRKKRNFSTVTFIRNTYKRTKY